MDGLSANKPAWTLLDEAVQRFGPRPAVNFFGRRWTYAQIGAQVDRAAAGLQVMGAKPGVNIGLCLPNSPYSVIMYFAILKTGATVVNFNPLYTEHELTTQLHEGKVSILVTIDAAVVMNKIMRLVDKGVLSTVIVCTMAGALPLLKAAGYRLFKAKDSAKIPVSRAYVPFAVLLKQDAALAPVRVEPELDVAVLQFTGGTTGIPKGAMLTHRNILANVQQVLATNAAFNQGQERALGVLPLFHVLAMTVVMNLGIAVGAELLLIPKPDIKVIMGTIYQYRPTMLVGVPTLYTAISNAAEAAGKTDLTFINYCVSGGAPLPAEVMERFHRISGCSIIEGYGLSETSPVVAFNPAGQGKLASVGVAVPGTVIEIRDPEHPATILPQGTRGEICVRGPQVMRGYYNRPAETADVMIEGALRSGDVGYLDEDGYLFIVDRIKDLIICGGYNVYPRIIEEAAYLHPAVQDAIAIGVPDKYRGQAPKVFVTLREGMSATPDELLAFLKARLNKIEMPKTVEIRDSLPKTMVGKLSKKELVAEEAAKNAVAGG
jgi:long-chain acyl-CoA synthetase